jgi:S-adenosylhomocysteine hydrolase
MVDIKAPIMSLPVLLDVVARVKEVEDLSLQKVVFVCVQHLLETTLDIFEQLIALGANPRHIFLLGKHYSTSEAVVQRAQAYGIQVQALLPLQGLGEYDRIFSESIHQMWNAVSDYLRTHEIEQMIILDDGGRCIEAIPAHILRTRRVISIEQTTAGVVRLQQGKHGHTYIDIATSMAKNLEANLLAEVLLNKMAHQLPAARVPVSVGVVGLGVVGTAVACKLVRLGYEVFVCDIQRNPARHQEALMKARRVRKLRLPFSQSHQELVDWQAFSQASEGSIRWLESVETVIRQSDYIFGCTGMDIMAGVDIAEVLQGNKTFISCSSEDLEFRSLLKWIQAQTPAHHYAPLEDIAWWKDRGTMIRVLKGGFPYNFDHSGTSIPAEQIQVTRALILGAVLQAVICFSSYKRHVILGRIMLDPHLQKFIMSNWLSHYPQYQGLYSEDLLAHLAHFSWIMKYSGGTNHDMMAFSRCFQEVLMDGT